MHQTGGSRTSSWGIRHQAGAYGTKLGHMAPSWGVKPGHWASSCGQAGGHQASREYMASSRGVKDRLRDGLYSKLLSSGPGMWAMHSVAPQLWCQTAPSPTVRCGAAVPAADAARCARNLSPAFFGTIEIHKPQLYRRQCNRYMQTQDCKIFCLLVPTSCSNTPLCNA